MALPWRSFRSRQSLATPHPPGADPWDFSQSMEYLMERIRSVVQSLEMPSSKRGTETVDLGKGQGGGPNVTKKTEIIMGDKYENLQGSTVVSRSEVKGSFNWTRDGHSTKDAGGGVWKWVTTVLWTFIKKRLGW